MIHLSFYRTSTNVKNVGMRNTTRYRSNNKCHSIYIRYQTKYNTNGRTLCTLQMLKPLELIINFSRIDLSYIPGSGCIHSTEFVTNPCSEVMLSSSGNICNLR